MYTRGAEERRRLGRRFRSSSPRWTSPARTDLDQLIKDDQFRIIEVPESVVVDGAVTSVDQLAGKSNGVAILAGEQIPVARISGNVPGGAVWIPEGMQALDVSLDAPRAVAGVIAAGDHVTLYATCTDVTDIETGRSPDLDFRLRAYGRGACGVQAGLLERHRGRRGGARSLPEWARCP